AVLAGLYAAGLGWVIERVFRVFERTKPSSAEFDWGPFVRLIKSLQQTRPFIGVKWLRETKLARDQDMVEALQVALDTELLRTYKVPNPKDPRFPVTACKLNETHPQVAQVLK